VKERGKKKANEMEKKERGTAVGYGTNIWGFIRGCLLIIMAV